MVQTAPNNTSSKDDAPIHIMLVDDSPIVRRILKDMIQRSGENMEVISIAINGAMAVEELKVRPVDVILLDIEMPRMNGLEAIPELLRVQPDVKIIMASILTQDNHSETESALDLGAVDYLKKPEASLAGGDENTRNFEAELIKKILKYGGEAKQKRLTAEDSSIVAEDITHNLDDIGAKPSFKPKVIAIGSSTGGPEVLSKIFKTLSQKTLTWPILVTQHMPKEFTSALSQMIKSQTDVECFEAEDGQVLEAGKVYIAAGGKHMTVRDVKGQHIIRLNDGAPVNFSKPSVDVMLNSLIDIYGGDILGVVLTGMGQDGKDACQRLKDSGGMVIAQNKASSAVWGMPGAIVADNIQDYVFNADDMGEAIYRIARGV